MIATLIGGACRCGRPVVWSEREGQRVALDPHVRLVVTDTGDAVRGRDLHACPIAGPAAEAAAREGDAALVKDVCRLALGLTDWERQFAESVARQVLDEGRPMTARQRELAEEILVRRGGR